MKLILFLFCFIIVLSNNINSKTVADEKEILKIGLILPLSGEHKKIGYSILNSVRMALSKIGSNNIKIYPRDNEANPKKTLLVANELKDIGINVVIGPVFNENLLHLNEVQEIVFLTLSNKIKKNNSNNIIYAGVNALSQFTTIVNFLKKEKLNKTIILIPRFSHEEEIRSNLNQVKHKFFKIYSYDSDPEKLTKQIQQITNYQVRKNNLKRRIKILENSNSTSDKRRLKILKKKDTLGDVNFDSIVIADFDDSLKSITTSFLYSDVNSKKTKFITLNQWFDKSLFKENSTNHIYFPSINIDNYNKFNETYFINFDEYPSKISIISYDILGLIYFLNKKNKITKNSFKEKRIFKGQVSNFEIKNNYINYKLQLYQVNDGKFKKAN